MTEQRYLSSSYSSQVIVQFRGNFWDYTPPFLLVRGAGSIKKEENVRLSLQVLAWPLFPLIFIVASRTKNYLVYSN